MFNNSRPIKSPVAYSAIEYHIHIKMNGMLKENAKKISKKCVQYTQICIKSL